MDIDFATTPLSDDTGADNTTNKNIGSIDDFFSSNGDIGDFVKQMQVPKEDIPKPPPVVDETGETIISNTIVEEEEQEEQLASYLAYTQDHYRIAEFGLLQIDKAFAFIASLITGEDMERYQIRLKDSPSRKNEAELAAALVNKYQFRLSIEFMFLVAIGMAYAPVCTMAFKDLKANKEKERKEKEKDKSKYPL